MGLQIRTYVNGNQEFIELYGNENIDMEVSFAEVQDITKKNSAFTQEFKVPGTKNNNFIFNYFFDINQVFTDWNPKKKFEADLIYDGYELYNGYVRLNSVSINKIEKVYSITFYSAVGDLVANIGDKALCNVDTTSLNHSLYSADITEYFFLDPSLHTIPAYNAVSPTFTAATNPVNSGDVNYILGQRGYDYTGNTFGTIRDINTAQTPLLDFSGVTGFFDFSGSPIISAYFIPSIRTRKLYELIVNQAGYYIESEFFNTDYFGRYYIPLSFNSEQPYMAQAFKYQMAWNNTTGQTNSYNANITNFTASTTSNRNLFLPQVLVENSDFNPVTFTNNFLDPLLAPYVFALPYSQQTQYTYQATIKTTSTGSFGIFPWIYNGGKLTLWKYVSASAPILAVPVQEVDYIVFTQSSGLTNTYFMTGTTTSSFTFYDEDYYFLTYTKNGLPFVVTGATFEILTSPTVLPKTIELHKEMGCDQKQIDFIQNINKTFNLVVVEHPTKTKTLIVEPMIDYVGKGQTLDWTDKVNYDATQNLYPTTNLINGTIFASNQVDKDYINSEYQKRTNKIFGQNQFDLDIDYKNQTTNLSQTLGQNTDYYLNASGSTNFALPCYFITKENNKNGNAVFEYRPFRSIPRQTFMSVSIPSGNTNTNPFFFRYAGTNQPFTTAGLRAFATYPNFNRLTTYPFALEDFSHYTIYDSSNTFTSDELVYSDVENQYDRYYRDYITDLTSDENKIYQVQMYLTPWEVAGLYYNEVIMIKNSKFRINKISNLSLLQPGLCNVELVKLTRDYTPSPVRFYDLISCDDPCDVIHTHTDIMYPIWAFEGMFIDVLVGVIPDPPFDLKTRYKVVRTEYNESYNYTIPYIATYRTQTLNYFINYDYAIYRNCTDTNPYWVLEPKNEYLSGYTGDCVSMIITNTGSTPSTFQFKYCDGVSGSWTLDPSSGITLCGLYSSFQTTGFSYCLNSFSACTSWTPLPTPTPSNTPGLSPTPTPTPSNTPGLPPSPTPTSTPTPSPQVCKINTTLNVSETGYIKYNLCPSNTTQYVFIGSTGSYTITDCIIDGSLLPGFPLADLAVYTVITSGTPC
jgi:hypothetical protein